MPKEKKPECDKNRERYIKYLRGLSTDDLVAHVLSLQAPEPKRTMPGTTVLRKLVSVKDIGIYELSEVRIDKDSIRYSIAYSELDDHWTKPGSYIASLDDNGRGEVEIEVDSLETIVLNYHQAFHVFLLLRELEKTEKLTDLVISSGEGNE